VTVRVLLACSDSTVAAAVQSALGDAENEIVHVATPHRALGLVDAGERYDVVIADADMTPEGGFALSRELKARALMGREVPPVALLITRHEDTWLASWSRADAFVQKPADPFDLLEVVQALASDAPVPQLPGVAAPAAPVGGDIFAIDEGLSRPETAINAGP
jgi:CheY-like chemotaxis protein